MLLPLLLALAPPPERAIGTETVIDYAGNGGLREWRRDPAQPDLLYVRDRTERWYRVRLTGACGVNQSLDTLAYTTDIGGRFDLFSRVSFRSQPGAVCGVTSITASPPPPDRQGRRSRR